MYHAGAVFASNYLVVVEAVAQRLLRHAGLTDAEAWQALRPLVEGTLENLARLGPLGALTGPVARGDEATVRRHVEALTQDDAALYRVLGLAVSSDQRITSYSAFLKALLSDREQFFEEVVDAVALGSKLRYAVLTIIALSGFFGLVAGAYSGPAQAVSAAVKLPFLFFATF